MAHRDMAAFPVRDSHQHLLWLAPVLILATLVGCSHRRSSMRPVYGTPVPATTGPSCSSEPMPSGTITTEPNSSEPFLTPASANPSTSGNDPVIRAGGSPPVPNAADEMGEPGLNMPRSSTPTPPNPGSSQIELNAPTALRSTGRIASVPRRTSRSSAREAVSAYLTDPNDLFQPSKADRPWKYVVLHQSASARGGYDQIDRDHRKVLGFDGCGYHFVIGNGTDSPDGRIEIAERWMDQKGGVHCRNGKTPEINEYGIGICLVGNFDQTAPTPKQVAAARALVAYLSDRYSIATDHLGTHDQFASGPTDCPGKNFPTEAILGTKHMASR